MISVIIPTYNRAELLRASLESLARQSISPSEFEVVVVNDGSTDDTPRVCQELSARLNLKSFRIENSGISAAKNLGVFASAGSILFFFDDDDVAHPDLLREHLRTHRQHPDENVAVLGFTDWAPTLRVTELMHFVTEVGCFLFSYPNLTDGQVLDFTCFWGGRSSCKRSLLVKHGVFNQQFRFGSEDIELGYRLSRFGLKVIFNRRAVQYMNRSITYEDFCRRCEKQGYSQYYFSTLHAEDVIQEYCQVRSARPRWAQLKAVLGTGFYRVREIEAMLDCQANSSHNEALRLELRGLYEWSFNGFKMKGILEAEDEGAQSTKLRVGPAPVVEPVVIYQMGKVGSKTIETSLRALDLGIPICHSHFLHDLDRFEARVRRSRSDPHETLKQIEHGKQLRKTILGTPYIRCRVISLVRDPVARNISAFFQNITEFLPDFSRRNAVKELAVEEIVEAFLSRYDHEIPSTWFQHQLKPVFGVDVLAMEFPKDHGYAMYETENVKLLVIKLEKIDSCVADAMREFLGIQSFALSNANAGEEKTYNDVYKAFLRTVVLPEDYLDRMYDTEFARHFYSDVEIRQFRARWARQVEPISGEQQCIPKTFRIASGTPGESSTRPKSR